MTTNALTLKPVLEIIIMKAEPAEDDKTRPLTLKQVKGIVYIIKNQKGNQMDKTKIKTDCFACVSKSNTVKVCFALKQLDCAGCPFYKHSDDPAAERKKIMHDMNEYSGRAISFSGAVRLSK